jgi:two-component system, cell cycle response regulator
MFALEAFEMVERAPFTVAVVDDDSSIRRLVSMILRRNGYSVLEATSGEEAQQVLWTHPWDLAVLDRWLPDLDGIVLCQQIKQDPALRNRYVIILTGEDEQQDKIEGLNTGADDYITKPFSHPELLARIRAGKRIVDLQNELIASNRRLELLSITDGLTQLYNHRHFQEEMSRKYEESSRYQRPLSLAMIDIDHFKKFNDTYGHAAGDEVLRRVSALLKESVRSADLAARYGGEEFAVMMPETPLQEATIVAEKVRSMIEEEGVVFGEQTFLVTVSIGVANYPHSAFRSPHELIDAADHALYEAKRKGRNQVRAEWRSGATGRKRSA